MESPHEGLLHAGEVRVDLPLVRRLLQAQHPDLAHLPLRPVAELGTVNVVVRLGEELAVRLPRTADGVADLEVELRWLPVVAQHLPLPVPEPVARGQPSSDYPFPWAVCRWVPGTTPTRRHDLEPVDTAVRLGQFVAALQAVAATDGPRADDDTQRAGLLASFTDATMDALDRTVVLMGNGRVEQDLFDPSAARHLWQESLAAPTWDRPGVWLHRDLYLGNLLTEDGQLTGVVDFGGLVVGDPAGNAMAAWHVLPADHRARFLDMVGVDDATRLRARAWVLSQGLLALPYYLDTHPGMVRMARTAITSALA